MGSFVAVAPEGQSRIAQDKFASANAILGLRSPENLRAP
jgi:hypothetical protein